MTLSPILLGLALAAGCGAPLVSGAVTGSGSAVPEPVEASAADEACSDLDQGACLRSSDCTLEKSDGDGPSYSCRPAEPPCETEFRQQGDGREECEAREACVYKPAVCYCPPDLDCFCGGGPPATCREAGPSDQVDPSEPDR